jgi:Tol biopolymer transport system component
MMRRVGLGLMLLAAVPGALHAQYFGQNKVQYRAFDFQIIRTEHFDIHFYEDARPAALDAARMAERSYARLSRILRHEYKERKPIILYASHSDFQQTNALGGEQPSEGTGGVTDFLKQRIILPFTGSYEELEHVLQHEMTHQFQYDIWSRGRAGAGLQQVIAINPPLWFVEGMAEYLSTKTDDPNDPAGSVDASTAMWLRDAVRNGKLPTIDQLENDPTIFPYRYGQALLAFIGARWGDEAIGAILQGTLAGGGGLEGALKRTIGQDYKQLTDLWHDAVQKRYLPDVAVQEKPRAYAEEILSQRKSKGTYHLAPALSPDGNQVAYFSERDFYFVDLWLADAHTGKVKERLLKSSYSSNYETYRFINSAASWSPDGKFIAIAAKKGPRDDIVIIDVEHNKEFRRIKLPLNGALTPSWSPDGTKLVFTGLDGGISDLFIVDATGHNLRRLTSDKNADFHPVWSPDGKTIAFATDRGPETDFKTLKIGNMKIALYHLDTDAIEVLPEMGWGTNRSPQWSPDGQQIAFVSDRTGVSNIFLFDFTDRQLYQLTDLFTGAQGITTFSPVISWAQKADRLASVVYDKGDFDVYAADNPRSLKRDPWKPPTAAPPPIAPAQPLIAARTPDSSVTAPGAAPVAHADSVPGRVSPVEDTGSLYRTPTGFREADAEPAGLDSSRTEPISISALMDSTSLNLPDTSEFSIEKYKVHYEPDYVARPTIGYTRDNFGRGFYGGSAIQLSDMLGNHSMLFSLYINGRITEAQVSADYYNLTNRVNWGVGVSQQPYYFIMPTTLAVDSPTAGVNVLTTSIQRIVSRSASIGAYYPIDRFRRIETSLALTQVSEHLQQVFEEYDASTLQLTRDPITRENSIGNWGFVEPSIAYTFDNSLPGYVGPFWGRRLRLSLGQAVGGWNYTAFLADIRRYDHIFGPFTLATRVLGYGRYGPDSDRFLLFLGSTDLLRGNTSGSYYRNECRVPSTSGVDCPELQRLLGTRIAVGNAELRFPLLYGGLGFLPIGFPPIEGAVFYDVGLAWDRNSTVKWSRKPGDDPINVRTPYQTIGIGARTNLFNIIILRLDYSIPQARSSIKGYWTLSLGPTF